jgi:hypothetical protein
MKAVKVGLAAAIVVGLLVAGSVALAAAASGGPIQVFIKGGAGPRAQILVTGAIGDFGKTVSVDKNGTVDNNGAFQKVTLQKGGFWVDTTALNKKLNSGSTFKTNPNNCSVVFSGSAETTLFNGSGAYKGIGGKVKITVTFAGVQPRFKSGKHKGKCNFGQNTNPLYGYQSITGVGTATFS